MFGQYNYSLSGDDYETDRGVYISRRSPGLADTLSRSRQRVLDSRSNRLRFRPSSQPNGYRELDEQAEEQAEEQELTDVWRACAVSTASADEVGVFWEDILKAHGTGLRRCLAIKREEATPEEADDMICGLKAIVDDPQPQGLQFELTEKEITQLNVHKKAKQVAGQCLLSAWVDLVGYTPTQGDLQELEYTVTRIDPDTGRRAVEDSFGWEERVVALPRKTEIYKVCDLPTAVKAAKRQARTEWAQQAGWGALDKVKGLRRCPWWFLLAEDLRDIQEPFKGEVGFTQATGFGYDVWVPGLLAQLLYVLPDSLLVNSEIPTLRHGKDWPGFVEWVHEAIHTPRVLRGETPEGDREEYRDVYPRVDYALLVHALELASKNSYGLQGQHPEFAETAKQLEDNPWWLEHLEELGEKANELAHECSVLWATDPGVDDEEAELHQEARYTAVWEYRMAMQLFVATWCEWATQLLSCLLSANEAVSWDNAYTADKPLERPRVLTLNEGTVKTLKAYDKVKDKVKDKLSTEELEDSEVEPNGVEEEEEELYE